MQWGNHRTALYCCTHDGAEVYRVFERAGQLGIAVENKPSSAQKLEAGFVNAANDLGANEHLCVTPVAAPNRTYGCAIVMSPWQAAQRLS